MNCDRTDCIHYKVCEEWKSLGNDNYINDSYGNCDYYAPTVEITEKQAITKIINSGWLVNHDKELREKWERPKCDCEECYFRKFTEKFVHGFVDALNKYGITSVEQLSEILKGGDNT